MYSRQYSHNVTQYFRDRPRLTIERSTSNTTLSNGYLHVAWHINTPKLPSKSTFTNAWNISVECWLVVMQIDLAIDLIGPLDCTYQSINTLSTKPTKPTKPLPIPEHGIAKPDHYGHQPVGRMTEFSWPTIGYTDSEALVSDTERTHRETAMAYSYIINRRATHWERQHRHHNNCKDQKSAVERHGDTTSVVLYRRYDQSIKQQSRDHQRPSQCCDDVMM
jgi:hypothetical protein